MASLTVRQLDDKLKKQLRLRAANFRDLATVAPEEGFGAVDGCLFDLGLSSFQLGDTERSRGEVMQGEEAGSFSFAIGL